MDKTAGIVIIGDEILSGKFVDENAKFLIGALAELGVVLGRVCFIPDDVDDIAATVRAFSQRFDWVFTSGGVGPTHDDVTMAGIARAFDTRVVVHPRLETLVRGYWGPSMPEANLRLAHVPEGAALVGTDARWPVVCARNVFILPGVPSLFRKKFQEIQERFRCTPVLLGRVYASEDEGHLAPHLDAVVSAYPAVKIGSYPRFEERGYRVLLTLESRDSAALEAAITRLAELLGAWVVRVERPASRS